MILVDTSVWSLALRKQGPADHPAVRYLHDILADDRDVALTGTILQEVLQAFRDDVTFRRIRTMLEGFPLLPLGPEDYVSAADLHRACATQGIAASTTDCQIATAAIVHDHRLLSTDKDFRHIAKCSSLRLVDIQID